MQDQNLQVGLTGRIRDYSDLWIKWGYSSVGRAPDLHSGGQEFESPYLHHFMMKQWACSSAG